MKNSQPAEQPDQNLTLKCPVTGEQVIIADRKEVVVQEEPIIWWHCPACRGWHVLPSKDNRLSCP